MVAGDTGPEAPGATAGNMTHIIAGASLTRIAPSRRASAARLDLRQDDTTPPLTVDRDSTARMGRLDRSMAMPVRRPTAGGASTATMRALRGEGLLRTLAAEPRAQIPDRTAAIRGNRIVAAVRVRATAAAIRARRLAETTHRAPTADFRRLTPAEATRVQVRGVSRVRPNLRVPDRPEDREASRVHGRAGAGSTAAAIHSAVVEGTPPAEVGIPGAVTHQAAGTAADSSGRKSEPEPGSFPELRFNPDFSSMALNYDLA